MRPSISMGKADLHIHSDHSDGMATVGQILEFVEHQTDLDLIAITDHDMFDGSEAARELAARRKYRARVVTGMEVTTLEGHLLALGIEQPIRSLQHLDKSIAQIHAQGGVAIVPHPLSWMIRSLGRRGIMRIHHHTTPEVYFDGFEVMNPSVAGKVTAARARKLNDTLLHLAETGGSDAHTVSMIGSGLTHFPGATEQDFRAALHARTTRADGHFWTTAELRELARIGPRQLLRSLVLLPGRHIRRVLRAAVQGARQRSR